MFGAMARDKGWDVEQGIFAQALPVGGRTVRSFYEQLRTTIVDDLKRAMPQDYDDCEGGLLEHIREVTGLDIPIGVELDPHCHISLKMMFSSGLMKPAKGRAGVTSPFILWN